MDQEDPELGLSAGEPPRKQQPAGRDDEAEEVAEGQEEEDAGDGEEEGPGEVITRKAAVNWVLGVEQRSDICMAWCT